MATSRELALEILPYFADEVLAGRTQSYGLYAARIGRDPRTESNSLGPAFHVMGAACIVGSIPVAPLHFVERQDRESRRIFEKDFTEWQLVRPHYKTLILAARFGLYQVQDFETIGRVLNRLDPAWSPHETWRRLAVLKLKGDTRTPLERALEVYEAIVSNAREAYRKRT